jgi:hypothetical protein
MEELGESQPWGSNLGSLENANSFNVAIMFKMTVHLFVISRQKLMWLMVFAA